MGIEMFSLEGKKALVTGASRGIGAAIALAYAECGADVALAARSSEDIEALADKIRGLGRNATAVTTDVTDLEQVNACVDRTIADLGGLDIVVNNAGGSKFMAPAIETRIDGWHKAIRLNLDSVFFFCQRAGAHLVEQGRGSVINMASVAGVSAAPTLSYYAAAKHGVIGLTKTLAVEWGPKGVRCNAIAPGWIKTDLNRPMWENEEFAREWVSTQPIARWGETEEITGAAVYLASDASRLMTGQTIVIDGGQTVA